MVAWRERARPEGARAHEVRRDMLNQRDQLHNQRVNATVRPVTALAQDASAAPVRAARYGQRYACTSAAQLVWGEDAFSCRACRPAVGQGPTLLAKHDHG